MTTASAIARIREMLAAPASTMLRSTYLTELARLCDALEVADRALEYMQFVHINKLEKPIAGSEVTEWALKHNANYAREARAEIARVLSGEDER